jgi:hypothetical protein
MIYFIGGSSLRAVDDRRASPSIRHLHTCVTFFKLFDCNNSSGRKLEHLIGGQQNFMKNFPISLFCPNKVVHNQPPPPPTGFGTWLNILASADL